MTVSKERESEAVVGMLMLTKIGQLKLEKKTPSLFPVLNYPVLMKLCSWLLHDCSCDLQMWSYSPLISLAETSYFCVNIIVWYCQKISCLLKPQSIPFNTNIHAIVKIRDHIVFHYNVWSVLVCNCKFFCIALLAIWYL